MEAADVLADQVEGVRVEGQGRSRPRGPRAALAIESLELVLPRRPRSPGVGLLGEPPQRVLALRPPQRREIVEQRVRPHIRGVSLAVGNIVGQRNAPGQVGPRDADVLKAFLDDVYDFIAAIVRFDELGMDLEMLEQRLIVLGQPKEEVRLFDLLGLLVMYRAGAAIVEVLLLLERLAAFAVQALVIVLVEHRLAGLWTAGVPQPAEQLLYSEFVALVGRADELVVGNAQRGPRVLEVLGVLVDIRLRGKASLSGALGDFLAVFIGAGQEVRLVAALAMRAGDHVSDDLFVRVAQVRAAVDVVDGGGDVKARQRMLLCSGRPCSISIRSSAIHSASVPRHPERDSGCAFPSRRNCSPRIRGRGPAAVRTSRSGARPPRRRAPRPPLERHPGASP